jgi:hypothetical protein
MRALLRQLGLLLATFALWHATAWAVSMVVVPPKAVFDSLPASETLYLTDAKLVAVGIAGMSASAAPKMIFLGPSNVTSAFRPPEVKERFPEFEVHQLSLGFHNESLVELEARLLTQTLSREVLARSVCVLGVWYGAFVEDGNPRLFNMDAVFLQSGLFTRKGGAIEPVASPAMLPLLVQLLRPFHFAQWLVESKLGTYKPHLTDRFVNAPAKGNEREQSLEVIEERWLGRKDRTLADQQFDALVATAKLLSDAGASVAIVDMALPRWHTEHASYLPAYEQQKAVYWPKLTALPHVRIVDLTRLDAITADDAFYDLNHVTMDATHLWADALKEKWGPP